MSPWRQEDDRPALRLPIPESLPKKKEEEEECTESSRIVVIDMVEPD